MFFIFPMNFAPSNPIADQPPRCPRCSRETEEERLARYSSGLRLLAEIGLDLARGLRQEALGPAAEAPVQAAEERTPQADAPAPVAADAPPDRPTLTETSRSFERVARAVRLSYMLEEKLIRDFAAHAKEAAKDAAEQAIEAERKRRSATKSTVNRVVKEAIQAEAGDQGERDHLLGRLRLRLDQDDMYRDLARKPAEILIARLFRDLELDPDWDRWQGEDWLNGDDYTTQDDSSAAPICPICRRAPSPAAAAHPDRPESETRPEAETRGAATGSDPP
jgi:hypothetical protein